MSSEENEDKEHFENSSSFSEHDDEEEEELNEEDDYTDNDEDGNDDDIDAGDSEEEEEEDGYHRTKDPSSSGNVVSTDKVAVVSRKRKRPIVDPQTVQEFTDQERQKGIVYLSRIPPYMKPVKIRHLLSQNGALGRIYLAPEDPLLYRKRVQAGGNKKIKYTEGWVEFLDKQQAKATAKLLQNTPVDSRHGGRGFYASDLWNIKYLKHFKWHHLTEKIAYEKRLKAVQLRSELHENRKAIEQYLQSVDTAKAITEMETKKSKQKLTTNPVTGGERTASLSSAEIVTNTKNNHAKSNNSSGNHKVITTTTSVLSSSAHGDNDGSSNIRRKFKQKEVLQDKALQSLLNKN